ncbi:MAG TPA: sulfite reductase subunit alpha [Opitutaceae bacterium]|nr:sulfite reductase subunit alpha [Opitutaceae bacterium]
MHPVIPDTAPFTPEQRAWLNGFFAGVFSRGESARVSNLKSGISNSEAALQPLTILFGSQTGTAESLAKKLAKQAGKRGFAATVIDMAQVNLESLASHANLLVITSTYGDGEPPDNAKELYDALKSQVSNLKPDAAPPLPNVRFSVCALGDTNYTQFCQCGKDFDAFLEKLGAQRVSPCAECELDYDVKFAAWAENALQTFGESKIGDGRSAQQIETTNSELQSSISDSSGFSRSNPFLAPVLTVRCLNGAGSKKEVNHVEFSLENSGLAYNPGDALGVFPRNCPGLVADMLAGLRCDGEEAVPTPDGGTASFRRALTELYDLGKPTPELLALMLPVAAGGRATEPDATPHHVIDVLLQSKIQSPNSKVLSPAEFVGALRKLQPRLYSIASSPRKHPGQVHLTVGALRYELGGRVRKGVCSMFLAERALAGGTAPVFVHASSSFRPPADGSTPMIMVGPGTGIAPFRAFLEEREVTGATGKNWLFFGDQHEATDFLYRNELLAMKSSGLLTRLDLAWSRDQAAKVYVQDRMLENAAELFAWLEAGAHFYVCGDASRMARDVDTALHKVVESAGSMPAEKAADYVKSLKAAKRYQRDVY